MNLKENIEATKHMKKIIADLEASLESKPEEEMTDFELRFMELRDIEWTLREMHSVIEGGEAREDYETIRASHHFNEIDDWIAHRIYRVRSEIKNLIAWKNVFTYSVDELFDWEKKLQVPVRKEE